MKQSQGSQYQVQERALGMGSRKDGEFIEKPGNQSASQRERGSNELHLLSTEMPGSLTYKLTS
jgi:hypothetical protein